MVELPIVGSLLDFHMSLVSGGNDSPRFTIDDYVIMRFERVFFGHEL